MLSPHAHLITWIVGFPEYDTKHTYSCLKHRMITSYCVLLRVRVKLGLYIKKTYYDVSCFRLSQTLQIAGLCYYFFTSTSLMVRRILFIISSRTTWCPGSDLAPACPVPVQTFYFWSDQHLNRRPFSSQAQSLQTELLHPMRPPSFTTEHCRIHFKEPSYDTLQSSALCKVLKAIVGNFTAGLTWLWGRISNKSLMKLFASDSQMLLKLWSVYNV